MYYFDPEDRKRQQEEGARTGVYNKMLSTPVPTVPYKQQPSWQDQLKEKAIKEGVKYGAGELGGQMAGGTPTPTGTDASGNTTFSDGGVVKPDGTVVKEGSYAEGVKRYGGTAAAAYNFYKAMQADDDKQKALGGAAAVNQGLMANNVYGAGPGAVVGGVLGAGSVLGSDMTDKQKAKALRRTAEDAAANYFTAGIYGAVQTLDNAVLGGQINKLRDKVEDIPVLNMPMKIGDKLTAKALGTFGSSKGEDQVKRDAVRKALQEGGFFGEGKDDWTLDNPDGSGWNVGIDGSKLAQQTAVDTEKQGAAIGAMNPLAYLLTGGDEKLATSFAGYFTNTITQGAGGSDLAVANANALDKYKKAGFDTPEKAHAGIDELVKAGKLDPEKAAAFHGGIDTVFGKAPKATGTSGTSSSSAQKKPTAKKKRRGDSRRTYEEQTYTPTTYAPQTTAPMGTPSPYGDSFAQGLANIYMANQGV